MEHIVGNPLISIVTVSLNDLNRLRLTVHSLNSLYGDKRFEHVIVDGGSLDGTNLFVNDLDNYGNVIFHQGSDSGIYDAMNLGVSLSSGRLVWFLNCGDTLALDKAEFVAVLNSLCSGVDPDLVCFPFTQVDGAGRCQSRKVGSLSDYKLPTSHQGMIFSKNFLSIHKYDNNYRIAADYDLYLRASRDNIKLFDIGKALVVVEKNGYASSHPIQSYREYFRIAKSRLSGFNLIKVCTYIVVKSTLSVFNRIVLRR